MASTIEEEVDGLRAKLLDLELMLREQQGACVTKAVWKSQCAWLQSTIDERADLLQKLAELQNEIISAATVKVTALEAKIEALEQASFQQAQWSDDMEGRVAKASSDLHQVVAAVEACQVDDRQVFKGEAAQRSKQLEEVEARLLQTEQCCHNFSSQMKDQLTSSRELQFALEELGRAVQYNAHQVEALDHQITSVVTVSDPTGTTGGSLAAAIQKVLMRCDSAEVGLLECRAQVKGLKQEVAERTRSPPSPPPPPPPPPPTVPPGPIHVPNRPPSVPPPSILSSRSSISGTPRSSSIPSSRTSSPSGAFSRPKDQQLVRPSGLWVSVGNTRGQLAGRGPGRRPQGPSTPVSAVTPSAINSALLAALESERA